MSKQALLIFSGYNQRSIIALCRWATINNIKFYIIAKSEEDTIFDTDYKKHVSFIRSSGDLDVIKIVSWCEKIIRYNSHARIIIIPSTEYLNRFLLKNRNKIENKNIIIPLVDYDLYKTISDKKSFILLCNKYSIKTPKEYRDIDSTLPFVAKPFKYLSGKNIQLKPLIISTKEDLTSFQKENSNDYFFQEFIHGKSFYLFAYIDKNNHSTFSQENLLQQKGGGSIVLAKQSRFHFSKEADRYINMLKNEKFHGIIMIEVREHVDTGKYYMIEANPRVWGPLQFIVDNDSDILYEWLNSYGFNIKNKRHKDLHPCCYYFWSGGVSDSNLVYHNYSEEKFIKNYDKIKYYDLFSRSDTYHIYKKETDNKMKKNELISLLEKNSKHSQYQKLAKSLELIINEDLLYTNNKYEEERFIYILNKINFSGNSVIDIGANTGYFALESLDSGAKSAIFIEGNIAHCDFLNKSLRIINMEKKSRVINTYISFDDEEEMPEADITFLLNVLHHIGEDYGNSKITKAEAKNKIIQSLEYISKKTKYLIFQLGFNWKGKVNNSLFEHGTKEEMINFITQGVENNWDILSIGIADKINNKCVYADLNRNNIKRNDNLGEFLNRPLFILKSKNKY